LIYICCVRIEGKTAISGLIMFPLAIIGAAIVFGLLSAIGFLLDHLK
jgi:hypothetical protein